MMKGVVVSGWLRGSHPPPPFPSRNHSFPQLTASRNFITLTNLFQINLPPHTLCPPLIYLIFRTTKYEVLKEFFIRKEFLILTTINVK